MNTSKIAAFDKVDNELKFVIKDAKMPEAGEGEVLFKVSAFALNQADLLLTQGRHYVKSELPIRLGYEGCGVIEAVGPSVTGYFPGDRISVIPNVDGPFWTAGEYAVAHSKHIMAWPEEWSAVRATSFVMQYMTPYYPLVERFPVKKGDWVMITAASGGTGLGTVALAKHLGARVIATSRSPEKKDILISHGAEVVLSTDDDDFIEQVMNVTQKDGVKLIIDGLGGPYVGTLAKTLAIEGILCIHGGLSGENDFELDVLELVYRQAGIHGYSLINELRMPGALERGRDYIVAAIAQGYLPPPTIDSVFKFSDFSDAYDRMKSGKQAGKIVVEL